jgi:hypothetical protein
LKKPPEARSRKPEGTPLRRHSVCCLLYSVFRLPRFSILASGFCLLASGFSLARSEIIDRIAVSVATTVITASEVDRAIRVTAFQNGVVPDFSSQSRRETAQRLVEQKLIRREMELSRYPQPDPSEADSLLDQLRTGRYKSDAEFQHALADYTVAEQDLRDALLWELTLVRFIEERFRPAVQVSNQELEEYFEKVVRPVAQAAHPGQPVALDDYRNQIEQTLSAQRADKEVDSWLKEARKRTEIVLHEEAFQ